MAVHRHWVSYQYRLIRFTGFCRDEPSPDIQPICTFEIDLFVSQAVFFGVSDDGLASGVDHNP